MVLHLGDGERDMQSIMSEFPQLEISCVRGNCDISGTEPDRRLISVLGKKIFMTHGHIYKVKSGYESAVNAARENGADILLFGHTHKAYSSFTGGLHVLNPGTISGLAKPTYGMIIINNDGITCWIKEV